MAVRVGNGPWVPDAQVGRFVDSLERARAAGRLEDFLDLMEMHPYESAADLTAKPWPAPVRAGAKLVLALALGFALAAAFFGAMAARGDTPAPANLMVTVFGEDDWSTAIPWVDLARHFRQWGTTDRPYDHPIPVEQWNPYGFPVVDFHGFAQYAGPEADAVYAHDGAGDITFIGGTTIQRPNPDGHSGTVHIVGNSKNLHFKVDGTNPADPFRNLSIRIAGYTAADTFTRPYLDQFRPFTTLRFLDWGRTNSVLPHDWEHRVKPGDLQTLPTRGVCWEYQIDLCNATGCAFWPCIPHWADDVYVGKLAALVAQRLKPGLLVYPESSNEVWNGLFVQHRATLAAAGIDLAKLDAHDPIGSTANADPSLKVPADGDAQDPYALQYRYQARRTVQIGSIFRAALGAGRVRPVIDGQAVIPWRVENALRWLKANGRLGELWGIGYADYHAASFAQETTKPTADNLIASTMAHVTMDEGDKNPDGGLRWIRAYKDLATQYGGGLQVVTYEGGPSFVDTINNGHGTVLTVNTDLHRAVQLKRGGNGALGIDDVVTVSVQQFRREGGFMYGYYASRGAWDGRYGYWAMGEGDVSCPKEEALLALAGLSVTPSTPPSAPPTTPTPPPVTPPVTPSAPPATQPTPPASQPSTRPATQPVNLSSVTVDLGGGATLTITAGAGTKVTGVGK